MGWQDFSTSRREAYSLAAPPVVGPSILEGQASRHRRVVSPREQWTQISGAQLRFLCHVVTSIIRTLLRDKRFQPSFRKMASVDTFVLRTVQFAIFSRLFPYTNFLAYF